MIRLRITQIFAVFFTLTFFTTIIVGIAYLFDSEPKNLYRFWKFLGNCLVVSFLFQLLFGVKITWK